MAIKISNNTVIDDSKNFIVQDITFADATVQASAAAGGGGAGVEKISGGTLLHTLDNPNAFSTSADDQFGSAVSISGNYMVVGAPWEDDVGGNNGYASGKAYIFNLVTGELLHTLTNPNVYSIPQGDNFGHRVAIDGNYVAVNALGEDDASGSYSGAVYVFNPITGSLLYTLTNPDIEGDGASDFFGYALYAADGYLIVGSPGEEDGVYDESGKAYVFDIATGSLVRTLTNPNDYGTSTNDQFGFGNGVSICSKYAMVGAYAEDDATYTNSGRAYIFDLGTGNLLHTLTNPNPSDYDNFGFSTAVTNDYAIVGHPGAPGGGKSYVHDPVTGNLLYTLDNPNVYGTAGAYENFGQAMQIDGNYVIIGAYGEGDAGGAQSGKAYIFDLPTGDLLYTLDNPNAYSTSGGDYFGYDVSMSANYAIAGAYREDDAGGTLSGKAYVFSAFDQYNLNSIEKITFANGFELTQDHPLMQEVTYPLGLDTLSVYHTIHNDPDFNTVGTNYGSNRIGESLAISGDYIAITANREYNDGPTNYGSGKVYLADFKTKEVLRTFTNPNAYGTADNDLFGYSVDIDGDLMIVGAYWEDSAAGADSGAAYVFNIHTGALLLSLPNPLPAANDIFGKSVAVNHLHNVSIVGAPWDNGYQGQVLVHNIATGGLIKNLSGSGVFGDVVATYGDYFVVGAREENSVAGRVYIYDLRTTMDSPVVIDNPNDDAGATNDSFGRSVSISGNYIAAGATGEDTGGQSGAGVVYIFDTSGTLYRTIYNPSAYSTAAGDAFGITVDISGDYVIVGATFEDDAADASGSASGKAYIFNIHTGELVKTLDNPNVYSTGNLDQFGTSVAISGGNVAVGTWWEGSSDGTYSGAAYLYAPLTKTATALEKIIDTKL